MKKFIVVVFYVSVFMFAVKLGSHVKKDQMSPYQTSSSTLVLVFCRFLPSVHLHAFRIDVKGRYENLLLLNPYHFVVSAATRNANRLKLPETIKGCIIGV